MYTSIKNIPKVIDPLFLDKLRSTPARLPESMTTLGMEPCKLMLLKKLCIRTK